MDFVFFLLGNSPKSEFYVLTFRNTLPVPSSWEVQELAYSTDKDKIIRRGIIPHQKKEQKYNIQNMAKV
jgi:hypothetical protein